jgi:hypothetical protein
MPTIELQIHTNKNKLYGFVNLVQKSGYIINKNKSTAVLLRFGFKN